MTILYPPILSNKSRSIPWNGSATMPFGNEKPTYDIYFNLPMGLNRNDIQHIQVTIKYYHNGEYAVNNAFSPDLASLFLDTRIDSYNFRLYDADTNLYVLKIDYECFKTGNPLAKTDYNVQVRFGSGQLWGNAVPAVSYVPGIAVNNWSCNNDGVHDFTGFANWRIGEINKVPSGFGEWSNSQKVYCYLQIASTLTYNYNDFVPELVWEFKSEDKDETISQVSITYSHEPLDGIITGVDLLTGTIIANGI